MTEEQKIVKILQEILISLKELNRKFDLLYNLFAKYDALAIEELEDLRAEEFKTK